MLSTISLPQASLALTAVASTFGSYIALSPPNQRIVPSAPIDDSIHRLDLTGLRFRIVTFAPLAFLAAHTSSLALLHPEIPATILRYGAQNGLNRELITWSPATLIPLASIILAGIPLRLISYASLGDNFTFALAKPDSLTTEGLYGYSQHPGYTGLVITAICNVALLARTDGALSCWIPPQWYPISQTLGLVAIPIGVFVFLFGIWTRVKQEEQMLRAEFETTWERWHANTARFIPWVI
ncbi:hypothetical protein F5B19DRAFT_494216 [Rostrohypoxylon terebratum]|nr:hypothetical protein F5B19DRAFT_494216 [Rostrohypoxylon terebratum]